MQLVNIFYIMLLVSASGLCISLIFFLNKITRSVKEIEKDIKDLTSQIKPLIISTTNLSERLNHITEQAKQPVAVFRNIVDDVKYRVDDILDFEDKLRKGLEGPVLGFVTTLSGFFNGINAFWRTYKRN